jgi:hypothetical protein
VEQNNPTTAAEATVDHDAHESLLDDLLARVAPCFARRETRLTCRDMVNGFLMELEDHNCWTIAEAAGHPGPHRMQHLLSRARCDDGQMLDTAAAWAAGHLAGDSGDAVLIVDETADAKSSADCAGASRQYSGTIGDIAMPGCSFAPTRRSRCCPSSSSRCASSPAPAPSLLSPVSNAAPRDPERARTILTDLSASASTNPAGHDRPGRPVGTVVEGGCCRVPGTEDPARPFQPAGRKVAAITTIG